MRELILCCKHHEADKPQKADESMSALKTYVMNDELKPWFALPCKNLLRACIVKEGAPIFSNRLHDVRLTYSQYSPNCDCWGQCRGKPKQ